LREKVLFVGIQVLEHKIIVKNPPPYLVKYIELLIDKTSSIYLYVKLKALAS
jgi:hypothetical protein